MAGIITDDVMAGLRRLADKLEGEFFISKEDVEKEIEPTVQGIMNGHVKYIRDRTEDEVRRDTIAGKIVEIAAMKKSDGGPTKRYHYDFLFESEYRVEVKRINKDVGFKYLRNDKQRLDTFINHSKAIDYFIVGDYEKANGGYNVIDMSIHYTLNCWLISFSTSSLDIKNSPSNLSANLRRPAITSSVIIPAKIGLIIRPLEIRPY